MHTKNLPQLLAIASALMLTPHVMAEVPKLEFPAPSPSSTVKQRVGVTDIEVDYSRPGIKGREIFGSLVPYNAVWRTGANQATKIIFSTPVKLNGADVPAGTYALMTIPGKDAWTVIINKNAEQWGAYKYDEKQDLARFTATPIELDKPVETFTIQFNNVHDDSATMDLSWDTIDVPVKVQVDLTSSLPTQIEQTMASDAKKKPYYQAAQFYFNHGLDLHKAKAWVDSAIAEREAFPFVYLKAQILAKLGDKDGALAAAHRAVELANKEHDDAFSKQVDKFIASLK